MRTFLLYILFLFSGAAGLVYELVWVRELIFVFGGTTYAITTVLVAFMAGLGLGSYAAGHLAARWQRPGMLYGGLEIGIGLYALAVPWLLSMAEPAYRGLYPQLSQSPWVLAMARFLLSGAVLVIPTTLMGATLPILVRYVALRGRGLGESVGYLYGINTLGAVLGVVAAGFWLIPTLGLTRTTWLAAAFNLTIGAIGILFLRSPPAPVRKAVAQHAKTPRAVEISPAARRVLLIGFAISGLTAMMYQITWTRALIMSLGSSTYAFTCILAAFILGLALGSLALAHWVDRWRDALRTFGVLELAIGLVAVVIVPMHGWLPTWMQPLVTKFADNYDLLLRIQFLLVIAITFVPTFLMGAIFPLVIRALAARTEDAAAATGRAYAVNTLGTIAGSFLAGFVLIRSDALGVQYTIVVASILNALVGTAALLTVQSTAPRRRRALLPAAGLILVAIVGLLSGRWDQRVVTSGPFLNRTGSVFDREIVYFGEGVDATVAVEHPTGNPEQLALTINGKPDASTGIGDLPMQLLLGHLPALLAPEGHTACVIGLGSGMTLAAVARYPSYQQLDCLEISAEVSAAATHFAPYIYDVLNQDRRVRLIRADGRNHLLLTDQTYDIIVSEPSNPWMAGVANLFTREFFELGRRRLSEKGLMAVWLHAYSMSDRDFQMVVRTLGDVFASVSLWAPSGDDYILVASPQPITLDLAEFARRFESPRVRADLYRAGFYRPAQILGRYITSGDPLRAWVAGAPLHTDDNALLEFSAPRYVLRQDGSKIATVLRRLQRPVFEDLSPQNPPPPALAAEVSGVAAARWSRQDSDAALEHGDALSALRIALDAFRSDPSSWELERSVETLHQLIEQNLDVLGAAPGLAELRELLRRTPPPLFAPARGTTLPDIAAQRRKRANDLAQRDEPNGQALELTEALRLEPGHLPTALALLDAIRRAGRAADAVRVFDDVLALHPDDGAASYVRALLAAAAQDADTALARLGVALRAGTITRESLSADERLAGLRSDPRFQSLLASGEQQ